MAANLENRGNVEKSWYSDATGNIALRLIDSSRTRNARPRRLVAQVRDQVEARVITR